MPRHPSTKPLPAASSAAVGRLARTAARTLVLGLLTAAAACASSGAVPRPFPGAPAGEPALPDATGTRAEEIPAAVSPGYAVSGTALGLRGAPYRNGGADPSGFDCSGFVWFVFAQHGIAVPRTVTEQFGAGQPVGPGDLQAGDLVFFSTVAPGASHVGMSIGGDQFVHAPSSRGEVRVERFSAPYWRSRFVGARRVVQRIGRSTRAVTQRDARPSVSSAASWTR